MNTLVGCRSFCWISAATAALSCGSVPGTNYFMLSDEIRYQILRELERDPEMSQRKLAQALGVSVGKTNYCVQALVDRGLVKVENFRKSGNKLAYAYQLTPRGIADKARVTKRFLAIKMKEYETLQHEIAELRQDIASQQDMEDTSGGS